MCSAQTPSLALKVFKSCWMEKLQIRKVAQGVLPRWPTLKIKGWNVRVGLASGPSARLTLSHKHLQSCFLFVFRQFKCLKSFVVGALRRSPKSWPTLHLTDKQGLDYLLHILRCSSTLGLETEMLTRWLKWTPEAGGGACITGTELT